MARKTKGVDKSIYFPTSAEHVLEKLAHLARAANRSVNEVIVMILENEAPRYQREPNRLTERRLSG
jgi:hypothetical protein